VVSRRRRTCARFWRRATGGARPKRLGQTYVGSGRPTGHFPPTALSTFTLARFHDKPAHRIARSALCNGSSVCASPDGPGQWRWTRISLEGTGGSQVTSSRSHAVLEVCVTHTENAALLGKVRVVSCLRSVYVESVEGEDVLNTRV
jgi:hypothetical protein